MKAYTQILKESLGDQAVCDRVGVPAESPERVISEAVRVKPKLQQRSKEVGNDRNVEHLQKKKLQALSRANPKKKTCRL
jgi:hypothetical protein